MIEQEEMDGEDDLDAHGVGDAINIEDPVRMYLKEIGKVPLLTADEEVAIAKRMENGDIAQKMLDTIFADVEDGDTERVTTEDEFWKYLRNEEQREEADEKKPFLLGRNKQELKEVVADGEEARKKLAEANLRLVVSIAKRYVGRGMLFLDLIQEGNLGLIKAVEKLTSARASSSLRMQPGGFVRQSQEPLPIRQEQSAFRFTWWRPSTSWFVFPDSSCRSLAANLRRRRLRTA